MQKERNPVNQKVKIFGKSIAEEVVHMNNKLFCPGNFRKLFSGPGSIMFKTESIEMKDFQKAVYDGNILLFHSANSINNRGNYSNNNAVYQSD